jgi:O-antigen/teichoic acid export membrane protein
MAGRGARDARAAVVNRAAPPAAIAADPAPPTLRDRLGDAWQLAHRWKRRVLFAFVDQGVYSLANFLLTILYASWLPLDDFGRYVVVWTVALFIEAIQVSLIVDSLPAIVSRHGRRNRGRLDAAAFWVTAGYSGGTSLALIVAALVLGEWRPVYVGALIALAAVNPLQRLYLLARRLAYIRDRQDIAAAMAVAYGIVSVGGAFVLAAAGALSLPAVILVWGLGALAAVVAAMTFGVGRPRAFRRASVYWLAAEIWRSGRWLSGAAVASWISNWAVFPLVAATTGAGTAGIIRALQNLLTPIVQFNAALHLAVLPRVADKVADVGAHYGRRFAWRGTAVFSAIAAGYCAVILAAAPLILPAVYRRPEIAAAAYLLWPLAAAIVLDAVRQASAISLLANRRTRVVFIARWLAFAVFAGGALVLHALIGFEGILWATAAASATGAAIVLGAALSATRTEIG